MSGRNFSLRACWGISTGCPEKLPIHGRGVDPWGPFQPKPPYDSMKSVDMSCILDHKATKSWSYLVWDWHSTHLMALKGLRLLHATLGCLYQYLVFLKENIYKILLTWQEEASQCHAKRGALIQSSSPTTWACCAVNPARWTQHQALVSFLPPGGAWRELLGTASWQHPMMIAQSLWLTKKKVDFFLFGWLHVILPNSLARKFISLEISS